MDGHEGTGGRRGLPPRGAAPGRPRPVGQGASVPERLGAGLQSARVRPEVHLAEVPAPSRVAPFAVALSADVARAGDDEDLATGRFVLLHDPAGQEAWEGDLRVVTFARAELDPETGSDPVLGDVGWSWFLDALEEGGVQHVAAGGTVTRVLSDSYGSLAERPSSVELEVRASWTPLGGPDAVGEHLRAWADHLLCTVAGLPPLPAGVSALRPSSR
ncbi:DUF3000 domain-containing protein [Pseudokineococcus sp. 1T1Z-3]|uniref:DUF3000 domain-containing protein n=1 Tax=Pseudokineococcus sp. 1T1Z-3 TaxID=3132745 RepID=UPI0030A44F90